MKQTARSTLSITVLVTCLYINAYASPADNGPKGFGMKTVGGSGKHLTTPYSEIIKISSLAEQGPNTLRACIEENTPRICVFEIGGVIHSKHTFKINNPYLTIAGETAPEPGILILGAGIEISTHDVIIRHLEIRPGDNVEGPNPESRDGLAIVGDTPSYNIIADHLSLSWAIDENISTGNKGVHDITISNSIISEALSHSIHPKGAHGMGMLIGDRSKRISIIGNLFAHNPERNPRIKFGASVVLTDNIIYNWGGKNGWYIVNLTDFESTAEPISLIAAGNVFKFGPKSPEDKPFYAKIIPKNSKIFLGNNYMYSNISEPIPPQGLSNFPPENLVSSIPELQENNFISHSGIENWNIFQTTVGSRPKFRNEIDMRIIKEVINGEGSIRDCILNCEKSIGAWPSRKTNIRKLTLPNYPFQDLDSNGHLEIEDWLNDFLLEVSP